MTYEKPAMTFVDLRNKTAVSGNCWSDEASSGGRTWYYDPNGISTHGYIQFTLDASCSGNDDALTSVIPVNYEGNPNGADLAIASLYAKLKHDLKHNLINSSDIFDDPSEVS